MPHDCLSITSTTRGAGHARRETFSGTTRRSPWLTVYPRAPFHGRLSTNEMPQESRDRLDLVQGTLDMLILRTLRVGRAHGHEVAKHIQRTTDDVLQVEHGSLYPALQRLERKGLIFGKWELAKDRNREFKYYRLTAAGRKRLLLEESKWKRLAAAIAQVMWPAEEG
jgi:PadR family transcriptional regulator PadR